MSDLKVQKMKIGHENRILLYIFLQNIFNKLLRHNFPEILNRILED